MSNIEAMKQMVEAVEAINTLRPALEQALGKMADNAKELALDYEHAGGTHVSKVWWDSDKLMAKPIPFVDIYHPATTQEPVARVDLVKAADAIVKEKFVYEKFIDGTPLANDIPCWMAAFAQQYIAPPAARPALKPLTDEQIDELARTMVKCGKSANWLARAIESALTENNGGLE
jgi:hypothetical protein